MGYMKIPNLDKDERVLSFKMVYVMEKIHGTSAHLSYNDNKPDELNYFSGGEKHSRFVKLFCNQDLLEKFKSLKIEDKITVFGEAYGGKMQGMKETYGDELRFVVFEVKIGDLWLSPPRAEDVTKKLGLDFVEYHLVPSDLETLDKWRDADSEQAIRNGMGTGHKREGIVIRPPFEVVGNDGRRIIAKYKRDDFRETKSKRRPGVDPVKLESARAIAEEWVTLERLGHALDALRSAGRDPKSMEDTGEVLAAMTQDVIDESMGEFEVTTAVKRAIGQEALKLWKQHVLRRMGR